MTDRMLDANVVQCDPISTVLKQCHAKPSSKLCGGIESERPMRTGSCAGPTDAALRPNAVAAQSNVIAGKKLCDIAQAPDHMHRNKIRRDDGRCRVELHMRLQNMGVEGVPRNGFGADSAAAITFPAQPGDPPLGRNGFGSQPGHGPKLFGARWFCRGIVWAA